MDDKKWIWEHEAYPNFKYDISLIHPLVLNLVEKQGILKGKIAYLSNKDDTSIAVNNALKEILSTSEIEGEILQRDSIRSSIEKRLNPAFYEDEGKDTSSRHTDALVDIYIYG
jgi:Fic family protein